MELFAKVGMVLGALCITRHMLQPHLLDHMLLYTHLLPGLGVVGLACSVHSFLEAV